MKKIKQSRNRWTLQLIPEGKGNPKRMTIFLYPTLTIGVLMALFFMGSIAATYFAWQHSNELDEELTQYVQFKYENEQLQHEMEVLNDKFKQLFDEVEELNQQMVDLQHLKDTVIELDESLTGTLPDTVLDQLTVFVSEEEVLAELEQLTVTDDPQVSTASYDSDYNETLPLDNKPTVRIASVQPYVPHDIDDQLHDIREKIISISREATVHEQTLSVAKNKLEEHTYEAQYIPSIPPATGRISSPFGFRRDPFTGARRMHNGLDFANSYGTPIYAAAHGTVVFAGREGGYGNHIKINHGNGYITTYSHLSSIKVDVGDTVKKGETIGGMGSTGRSTGVHLHYEVHKNGQPVNPIHYIRGGK